MTYEQMEKTMQFILEQQAASSEWQKRFEENLARRDAESADWQKRFEENLARFEQNLARSNADSADWQQRFERNLAEINDALAASAKWQKQAGENFGSLMGDAVGQSAMFENVNIEIEKLTDRLSTVAEQLAILTENVNTLSATVKNMIKGGDNGWQQH